MNINYLCFKNLIYSILVFILIKVFSCGQWKAVCRSQAMSFGVIIPFFFAHSHLYTVNVFQV